jgi:hypothetical protein
MFRDEIARYEVLADRCLTEAQGAADSQIRKFWEALALELLRVVSLLSCVRTSVRVEGQTADFALGQEPVSPTYY